MNYDNYLSGDYDPTSPVNQKGNDFEGFDFETIAVDDYVKMVFARDDYYSGFVTFNDTKQGIVFFKDENTEEIERWCYYRQIVKVGGIDINN